MTGASVRSRIALASIVGLSAVLFVVEQRVGSFHAIAWLSPDSAGYLDANVFRAPLYPLILKGAVTAPGEYGRLGLLQHLLFLGCGTVLAWRYATTFGRPVLAALFQAAVLGNPLLVSYCFTVLPEAVFASLLMIHLARALSLASRWTRGTAISLSVSAALLPLVKPAGYAAVAGLVVVAVGWRRHWRQLHWLIVPAAAILLGVCGVNYAARGMFAIEAQGGYARLAYVGQLLDSATPTDYPDVTRAIAARTTSLRLAMNDLPTIEMRYLVGSNEYHVVESIVYREMLDEVGRKRGVTLASTSPLPSDPNVVLALDGMGSQLANAAIRTRPLAYVDQIWTNLYGLWWLPLVQSRARLPALEAEIQHELNGHSVLDRSPIAYRVLPGIAYAAIRTVLAAVLLCALAGFALIWSRDPRKRVVGYFGLLLHGYFLLVSLAQPGLPRYAVVAWPASMLVLFGAWALVLNHWTRGDRSVAR
jgi:hypothetical protein